MNSITKPAFGYYMNSTTKLAFLDTETTGLDYDHDDIWEIALIIRASDGAEVEHHYHLAHDASRAALLPASFFTDYGRRFGTRPVLSKASAATLIRDLTWGAIIVGCNPQFDLRMMHRLLVGQGVEPGWHYRPLCVETLAAGYLLRDAELQADWPATDRWRLPLPWKSDTLSAVCEVPTQVEQRHTALYDARWARDWFDRVAS